MMIGALILFAGIIVFLVVFIIEGVYLSKQLSSKWLNSKIIRTVFISNLVSTLIGTTGVLRIVLTWAANNSIGDTLGLNTDTSTINDVIFILIIAFVLTILLEVPINVLFLKKEYKKTDIVRYSIHSNILTYILIWVIIILSPIGIITILNPKY